MIINVHELSNLFHYATQRETACCRSQSQVAALRRHCTCVIEIMRNLVQRLRKSEKKKRSSHGQTDQSGSYGPVYFDDGKKLCTCNMLAVCGNKVVDCLKHTHTIDGYKFSSLTHDPCDCRILILQYLGFSFLPSTNLSKYSPPTLISFFLSKLMLFIQMKTALLSWLRNDGSRGFSVDQQTPHYLLCIPSLVCLLLG